MSCFWDALVRELSEEETDRAGLRGIRSPQRFADCLKASAVHAFVTTKWQGDEVGEKQRRENAAAVQNYDTKTVGEGYWCGSCDPFLLLVSHVAGVHIRHVTPSGVFEYTSQYPKARWMELRSNSSHMH